MANESPFSDGLLDSYSREALKELSEKNWHEVNPNALILICHAINKASLRRIAAMLRKPLYILASTGGVAVIWMIIRDVLGL